MRLGLVLYVIRAASGYVLAPRSNERPRLAFRVMNLYRFVKSREN